MPAINTPTPPLVGGNSVRNPIMQDYVFQSGIHEPEHSRLLTYKYPQYFMTSLLDRLGADEPYGQEVFTWNVMDRTRLGGTVSTLSALGSATCTFEIAEFDYAGANLGYLIVGDVIRLQSGALGLVTASVVSTTLSNKQKVTVKKVGGGNWAAADIANTDTFGHVFTSFEEGSQAPVGRLFLPTEEYNRMTILRRSVTITGSEFTNRTYLKDNKSFYWEIEEIHRKEFMRDREGLILFGKLDDNGPQKVTRGIIDYVEAEGVVKTFASATGAAESDLQAMIRDLVVEGASNEILVLCGSKIFGDLQVALKDYALNGALMYGRFGNNEAGLDFQTYSFMGKKLHFAYYELFDDKAMVPSPTGGASAADIDFSDFSLWLDLGNTSAGESLIKLVYKSLGGESRKLIQAVEAGMMNPSGQNGGMVSSGFDGFSIHWLSEVGIKVINANRMGILRANS